MALAHELNKADNKGPLNEESSGAPFGEVIRDYKPLPDTIWRFGRPNYARLLPASNQGAQRGVSRGRGEQNREELGGGISPHC